jgi:hypothetical protein
MADPITGAAAVASIASVGMQAYGDVTKSQGASAGDQFKAAELDRAAQYGDLKAQQTSGQLTRNLSMTLGNIDAIRAAAHDDPSSPTGAAVRDYTEEVGTEQKTTQVDSILAQSQQQEADAAYLRKSASDALLSGDIAAGSDVLKGLAGGLGSLGGKGGSSGGPAVPQDPQFGFAVGPH